MSVLATVPMAIIVSIVPVAAQAQGEIKVWPTRIELTVEKGEKNERSVNIENKGNESIQVHMYGMDFTVDSNGSYRFTEPGHENYSASTWLYVEETDFELLPLEHREIRIGISVPSDVEPGGHYAALFVEAIPSTEQRGVAISTRIPSLFYITTSDASNEIIVADADIISLILPRYIEKGPADIGAIVRNSGNVHLDIAAKAHLIDSWGRSSEVDMGQVIVLPNSERAVACEWREAPFFGRVRTSIIIGYFNQQEELTNKSHVGDFWIVPWKAILVIGAGLCLIGLAIWTLSRRYYLRIERK